ncbi:winged helix-turn-helix domain-containing protein [Candidatus Nitrosocosmicus franklandus]|nr:winged helix-turn-helix domain-containing protein [Candidatus Nitrosocosmicus franklandus]
MELYHDILKGILDELVDSESGSGDGKVKPTRVQLRSNLAYDKLVKYLDELEDNKMIIKDPLQITPKGRDFVRDFDRIASFLTEMGIRYFDSSTAVGLRN